MQRLRYQGNRYSWDRTRKIVLTRDGATIEVDIGKTADFTDEEVGQLVPLRVLVVSTDTPVTPSADVEVRMMRMMGVPQSGDGMVYDADLDLWIPTPGGPGAPGPAGPPGAAYRGPWEPFVAYRENELVTHLGVVYAAVSSHTSGAAFISTQWIEIPTGRRLVQVARLAAPVAMGTIAQTDIPGLALVDVDIPASTWVKLRCYCPAFTFSVTGGSGAITLHDGATQVASYFSPSTAPANNTGFPAMPEILYQPTAGVHTYRAKSLGFVSNSTPTIGADTALTLEFLHQ